MSLSAPTLPVGTICYIKEWFACIEIPNEGSLVEVIDCTWTPRNGDNWLVRKLDTGEEIRVWGFDLAPVSPLEALATAGI